MKAAIMIDGRVTPIELPDVMDVLIHLPESQGLRDEGLCVAHALQYNISAKGPSPAHALERLIDLVTTHCREAALTGIHPVNIAPTIYLRAFHLGVSVPATSVPAHMDVRLSKQLASAFQGHFQEKIRSDVRTICDLQKQYKGVRLEALLKMAAA